MIARYKRGAAVVVAVLILGLAGIVALAGPAAAATTASFSASGWETGFTGQYTISNSGPGTVNSWQLQFDLPAGTQVGSFWDANMTRAGNHYTFTNRNYNATIAVGASVSFGFVASGTGRPSNCTVNGAACGGGGTTTTGPTTTGPTTTGPTTTTRPTTTTGPTTTGPTTTLPAGAFNKVGYFTQWGIYGRAFFPKNLVTTGNAARMTHINYAFENIHPTNLTCLAGVTKGVSQNPQDPNQGDGAGDAEADYQRTYNSGNSVDGSNDTFNQPLAGNFNQLRQLKAHPQGRHLKILVSLGGWTFSKYFSDAALTAASRQKFVSSCIDIYIKGNLPTVNGRGGPGSAANIFDGIDLDWEWPGAEGHPGNHVRAADKQNFTLLLQEFRRQLDEVGAQTGKRYLLTSFLPADPVKINQGWELDKIFQYLDFGNVQGYDFHGSGSDNSWEPNRTGHQSNLFTDVDDPYPFHFSIEEAINTYIRAGVSPRKLTIGIPFYGRGWQQVADGGKNGEWQTAGGAAPGQFPEEASVRGYTNMLANVPGMRIFHDDQAVSAFGYTGNNGQWWTFDDPTTIARKAQYVKSNNLLGMMAWELSGDDGSLMGAINNGLR